MVAPVVCSPRVSTSTWRRLPWNIAGLETNATVSASWSGGPSSKPNIFRYVSPKNVTSEDSIFRRLDPGNVSVWWPFWWGEHRRTWMPWFTMAVWVTLIGSMTVFSGLPTTIRAASAAYVGKRVEVTATDHENGVLTIAKDVVLWQHTTE
jgi:hypothetical protein